MADLTAVAALAEDAVADEEDEAAARAARAGAAGAAAAARAEATSPQMATQNSPTAAMCKKRWPRKIGTPSATC